MINKPADLLSDAEIKDVVCRAIQLAEAGQTDEAWNALQPLRETQSRDRESALALIHVVEGAHLSRERALELLVEVQPAHADDPEVIGALGNLGNLLSASVRSSRAPRAREIRRAPI